MCLKLSDTGTFNIYLETYSPVTVLWVFMKAGTPAWFVKIEVNKKGHKAWKITQFWVG